MERKYKFEFNSYAALILERGSRKEIINKLQLEHTSVVRLSAVRGADVFHLLYFALHGRTI